MDANAARSTMSRYPRDIARQLRESFRGTSDAERLRSIAGLAEFGGSPLAASWLGHATVLLHVDGKWILTDPVFSQRIGMRLGKLTFGVDRLTPAIDPIALPPIDIVLISHAHYDHFDAPSLEMLARPGTTLITAAKTRRLVPKGFGEVIELPWKDRVRVHGLEVSSMRPNHWGARAIWDRHRGFNSYVVRGRNTGVLYAGDTAESDAFHGIEGLDLSVFGIGAYDPWIKAHATPEQVWKMHKGSGATYLLPMHHSTFKLSDEPRDEPLQRLLKAAGDDHHRVVARDLAMLWRADGSASR